MRATYLHLLKSLLVGLILIFNSGDIFAQNDSIRRSVLDSLVILEESNDTIRHYGYVSDSVYLADTSLQFQLRPGYHEVYLPDSSMYMKGRFTIGSTNTLVRTDSFFYYYSDGTVRDCGRYNDGARIGVWKHFDAEGKLVYTQEHPSRFRVYYHKKGGKRAEGTMKRKEMKSERLFEFLNFIYHEGQWKFYGLDEKCACKGRVVKDAKLGDWVYYSVDRKNKIKREYTKPNQNHSYGFLQSCLWR